MLRGARRKRSRAWLAALRGVVAALVLAFVAPTAHAGLRELDGVVLVASTPAGRAARPAGDRTRHAPRIALRSSEAPRRAESPPPSSSPASQFFAPPDRTRTYLRHRALLR